MLRLLCILALSLSFSVSVLARDFVDIASGHWAKSSIDQVVGLGILAGYEDDTFRGDATVNRYEFAIFIDNLLRVMDRRYASKASQDALIEEFQAFMTKHEADEKLTYKVTKTEWQNLLRDIEYLRAEVSELRKQVNANHAK